MPSVDAVAASLAANKAGAEELAGQLAECRQQAEELQGRIAALGAEGTADLASSAVHAIEELMAEAASLADRIGEAQSKVLAIKQGALLATKGSGNDPPDALAAPSATSGTSSGASGFNPSQRNPHSGRAVRRFGGLGTPRAGSARAGLFDSEGNEVLHQLLRAKRGGEVFDAPELKDPWRSDRAMKTTWHIEGGVAAYMRRTKTKVMALWLNVPPCEGLDRADPKGCYENLPKILPKGYTLYVHAELENGGYQRVIVKGTGEALR
ncbi:DddA-like double-stranded DNA deaminase toxin [Glycomyces sp. NPDC049804]|uniref:DddA-like double-stranded DNA deaminase toxin n=1 Tax=Glycomyces sp. NPDC049804 TaxID=3154363 RepID=UPI003439CA1E